jgi:Protein of unknown function (DUF1501)
MKRRDLLAGAGAISMLDWLGYFRRYGVPGTNKSLGIAEAVAQAVTPRFLIYWFQEGGWDSYSMFSPVDTRNDAILRIPAGTLRPTPSWSEQIYRPKNYGAGLQHAPKTVGNITYGFLAQDGVPLFNDMAVVSSHLGNTFHSGGRWEYHYGRYANYAALTAQRGMDERSVMQAFCEAYGANYAIPHVSWHRWLSDGELEEANYPDGTGYYERLGPSYAHTVYGKTPTDMRNRLSQLGGVTAGARTARIRQFADNLHQNFIKDKNGESVAAFSSAVSMYKQLTNSSGTVVNPTTLFTDPTLRSEFGVTLADEQTNSASINGNPARSKDCPQTNVQALMTYELMTKGLSIGFWIESRQIRGFDTHQDRKGIISSSGQQDQLSNMNRNLWTPLKALATRLKNTPYGASGKSYWDLTTIVLASEMGRTAQGDVTDILNKADSDSVKYTNIMDQDCCQHWRVGSVAFLGGTVQGNRQYGKVGTTTLEGIPLMPDGTLDPAYNPQTGVLMGTKSTQSVITDAGNVYSTALALAGVNPAGKGRNNRPAMGYIKKP